MFENNIIFKRLIKRKNLQDALDKAREEGLTWKINQLESKIHALNSKYYPTTKWDSSKGTYKKKGGK